MIELQYTEHPQVGEILAQMRLMLETYIKILNLIQNAPQIQHLVYNCDESPIKG